MEKLKAAADKLGLWGLKCFRGLICEKKDGGWELSQGRVMAWLLLSQFVRSASLPEPGTGVEWLFYGWVASMTYCGYSKVDLAGAMSGLRK